MGQEMTYDFDTVISRAGTHAEKYDARSRFFGKADVEPFWVADMDLPTPAFVVDAIRDRLDHPMFGYTEQYDAVFDSIAWWMRDQHGANVERAHISLSPSVVVSISNAVQVFTEPGEAVAVLSPVYGPFFTYIKVNKRRVEDGPLRVRDGRFEIDFEALSVVLAKPETKLMLLCNPQNPGGRVWTTEELTTIVELCTANEVTLFSDEIHCDIVYPPHRHQSILTIPGAEAISVVAHSIGKTFNTSGLQTSFVITPNPKLRGRFRRGADRAHVADVNVMGKIALATALSPAGVVYKQQLVTYLRENTRLVAERLGTLGIEVMEPEATFLVWSDFRTFGPWNEVFKILINEANVALSGGNFFGPAGEGWFRVNCAHPRSQLLPAVDRIVDVFSNR